MPRASLGLAFVVLACSLRADAQARGASVQVPRGGGVTIDGRVDDAEWRDALRMEHPAGTVVRLLRDGNHLYLGITSERPGFASLCVAQGNTVHVLHASAALGAVTYRASGDGWQSADTAFSYGMRNTARDDAARAQRASYLTEHGWMASTVRMSQDQRSQEFQIALGRFALPMSIALARWLSTNRSEWWPGTITDHDGCFSQQLVRGYVPQGVVFKTPFWVAIENR